MRLTDCFMDVVAYVAYFLQTVTTRQPSFDQVRSNIQQLMAATEDKMRQGGVSQSDYDLARFAICAWVDEAILSSGWQEKAKWQASQLQRFYYQTTDAGEIFFDKLNSIGPHQRDVREVYYLCLAMGLKGRFCHQGDEYLLEQVITSNLKVLTGSSIGLSSLDSGNLFPEAYSSEGRMVEQKGGARGLVALTVACLALPVFLCSALYLLYRFILGSVGENLLAGF